MGLIKDKIEYEYGKAKHKFNLSASHRFFADTKVADIDETLARLNSAPCSMCRFGDGEYKVMHRMGNGFQKKNKVLSQRLREIIKSPDLYDDLLVCIPNFTVDNELRTEEARMFWTDFLRLYGASFVRRLKKHGRYYDAHVTRLYYDYRECGKSGEWFSKLKKVWQDRDLLIVEGEKTKLGIGNDLFDNAKSIKRILAPSQNAFDCYDEILESVKAVHNGELVLIALGQTATVLAFDLHKSGIYALDIGHIDIEYEWFLSGATSKKAVAGKFVKEVDIQSTDDTDGDEYKSQIIKRVGV